MSDIEDAYREASQGTSYNLVSVTLEMCDTAVLVYSHHTQYENIL